MKPPRAATNALAGNPKSSSTLAKPKPCTRPNTKAKRQRLSELTPSKLFKAASTTDKAIAGSTKSGGGVSHSMMVRPSVMECATVNAVTTASTSISTGLACGAAGHWVIRWREGNKGASTNKLSKKTMWSIPIQMCHTPSMM